MRFPIIGLLSVAATATLVSCASLKIENVDFGWPVESVISVGDDNVAQDKRYSINFPTTALAMEEFQNPDALKGRQASRPERRPGVLFRDRPEVPERLRL